MVCLGYLSLGWLLEIYFRIQQASVPTFLSLFSGRAMPGLFVDDPFGASAESHLTATPCAAIIISMSMHTDAADDRPVVLYSDRDVVLSIKPPGYLAHFNPKDRRSPNALDILKKLTGGDLYAVHRLDRGTSGLMLLARNRDAASELSRQFRERLVGKIYLALVRGHLDRACRIERALSREKGSDPLPSVTHVEPLSRVTLAEPVGRYDEAWYTFVRLRLETGRLHQARRHLRSIDHPVIGDMRHGDREQSRFFARRFGMDGLMLRAYELTFAHPVTRDRVLACAGLPPSWTAVAEKIGLALPAELRREPVVVFRAGMIACRRS